MTKQNLTKKLKFITGTLFLGFLLSISGSIFAQSLGAGVIPYMRDKKGKLFFLLGLEKRRDDKKGGKKGGVRSVWTDFGGSTGKYKSGSESGAHEYYEETCGTFTRGSKNPLDKSLKQKAIKRITNKLRSAKRSIIKFNKGEYCTFFLNITPEVINQGGKKNTIRHLETNLQKLKTKKKHSNNPKKYNIYLEKKGFDWFNLDDFKKGLQYKNKHRKNKVRGRYSNKGGHYFYKHLVRNINNKLKENKNFLRHLP